MRSPVLGKISVRSWLVFLGVAFLSGTAFAADNSFRVQSPAFENGGMLSPDQTCDGKNESPALTWEGAPQGTESFVLIMEDPDAPTGNWVHWMVYDLPPVIHDLPGGFPPIETLANGEHQGTNSFQKLGYGGPCPPSGTHHYYFRFYALDRMLSLKPGIKKKDFEKAIKGHILAKAELMGLYQRRSASH